MARRSSSFREPRKLLHARRGPAIHDGALQWHALLRPIKARLAELGIDVPPPPVVLSDFVADLERARGRRIDLRAFRQTPGAATICGYAVEFPEVDVVFYQRGLTTRASTHHALHELAHLALEHRS